MYYVWRYGVMSLVLYYNGHSWSKYIDGAKLFHSYEEAEEFVNSANCKCYINDVNTLIDIR